MGAQRHGVKLSQEKRRERDSVLRLKEPRVLRLEEGWLEGMTCTWQGQYRDGLVTAASS